MDDPRNDGQVTLRSPAGEVAGHGPTLVAHLDIDAFFAAVEQRDKPSLRNRPVVVGGTGPRGVVATASYEARAFGIHSAMPMAQARRRCPRAAILAGRFEAYRRSSEAVMDVLSRHCDRVEQVSLDEAYLLLPHAHAEATICDIRREIASVTGLTASVGAGTSKLVAKIASDLAKPDGVLVVDGDEQAFLDPLPVRRLPGLGPASEARLSRLGIATVAQIRALDRAEVVGMLGEAHGDLLWQLAHGRDERRVEPEHEMKSISVEETFDTDLSDPVLVQTVLDRMSGQLARRLRDAGVSGRTVTLKARYPDFTTITRSATRPGPTDDPRVLARTARALRGEIDLARGVRLLGLGCSGLTQWVQPDLFDDPADGWGGEAPDRDAAATAELDAPAARREPHRWRPGQDVAHSVHGRGWVWGSGAGVVTVRFESRGSAPGPVRTFGADDPHLQAVDPEDLPGVSATLTAPRRPRPGEDRRPPRPG